MRCILKAVSSTLNKKKDNAHTPTKENSVLYENVSGQLLMNECNALS